jgi:LysR family transcriptional regulator, cyn operon transcriptional activator
MRHALRYLPTFVAVVENGGVKAAAAALHKTQAAVSYDLKRLQDVVGASLMVRNGRQLRLTDRGRLLLNASRRLVDECAQALGRPEAPETPLRIASVSGFGRYVVHGRWMARYPQQPIELRFFSNENVIARVRDDDADLGFCFEKKPSRSVVFEPVYREKLVLTVPQGLRLRAGNDGLRTVFDRLPAVAYDESDYVFARWFSTVTGDARRNIRFGDRYAELEEAIRAVAAGRGYSIVPLDAARALSAHSPVRVVAPTMSAINTVYAIYGRHRENEWLPRVRGLFGQSR